MYFTIRANSPAEMGGVPVVKVNYDSLGEDVEVGEGQDEREGWRVKGPPNPPPPGCVAAADELTHG